MRKILLLPILFFAGIFCGYFLYFMTPEPLSIANADIHYSPHGGCLEEIIKVIGTSKKQIRVFSYSFTSEPIAKALIAAKYRGVDVAIIMDAGAAKYTPQIDKLVSSGIAVYLDNHHHIMHNKVIVIDDHIVLTGSFNFSVAAEEHNAENLLTIHSKSLAASYIGEWEKHRQHSKRKVEW